ncbi:unnamed protein product [Gongylonema pulchrum]|uniref:Lipase_3 domain-containing protein n=1 Tax=Gongylonema pulchrum TaxID=637853 RepID=A0A183E7D5_9BILA|nr:unnamed protein product [Gongylonema pulchrum]
MIEQSAGRPRHHRSSAEPSRVFVIARGLIIALFCAVQRLAEEFGGKHVKFRVLGFKADFFGAYADATITECTFLDNAVHPAHQTLAAFSSFVTMVYSSVRDGFYAEMRRMRRASNSFSTGSNSSCRRKIVSADCGADCSPR